jgi:hypothetical protein
MTRNMVYTFQEFMSAKDKNLIIHDYDLKRWALYKKRENGLENFIASHDWLWRFKSQNRIVSRKITQFVTSSYSRED